MGEAETPSNLFISYSHQDIHWKDRVLSHLKVLEQDGLLTIWEDRAIRGGDDWFREIEAAIDSASVAVLLISANFLTSPFIKQEELPRLLKLRAQRGLHIYPVLLTPCAWQTTDWLRSIQLRPTGGRPLSAGDENQTNTDLAAIAGEIYALLRGTMRREPGHAFVPLPPEKISISRLPTTGNMLFGREAHLEILNRAWTEPNTNVLSLVAWGGVGKSTLVNYWLRALARNHYLGAERVYAWSFYQQGTSELVVSADEFIESTLTWFDDPDPNRGTPWNKGERLANLIRRQRVLLLLDGLEPLQYPSGPQEGLLKDRALRALLGELAGGNPGLCIISTRFHVRDLENFEGSTAKQVELEYLTPAAGAQLLRAQGVHGPDSELEQASVECDGHCLTLTLLGSYLNKAYGGDIIKRETIRRLSKKPLQLVKRTRVGDHASRMMETYERLYGDGPELAVLRLLGFFDRPADPAAFDSLKGRQPIHGLTHALQNLAPEEVQLVLDELRRARLLAPADPAAPGTLDTHTLIRGHFRWQVKELLPDAWREGNRRLYEHFKRLAPPLPETLQEMELLFRAMAHGCEAGHYHDVLHEIYYPKIMRSEEAYAIRRLGARGAVLSSLSSFFEEGDWSKPVEQGLRPEDQLVILDQVGLFLTALKGYASEEVQNIYRRVEELCGLLGKKEPLYSVWISRWRFSLVTKELTVTLALAKDVFELARGLNDAALLVGGYRALAITHCFMGEDFMLAQEYAREGIDRWSSQRVPDTVAEVTAPIVTCFTVDALALWHLGEPDKARAQIERAAELAWQLYDMNALALALILGCFITQYCGMVEQTFSNSRELIEICERESFALWLSGGKVLRGWSLAAAGKVGKGIALMEQGLREWKRTGARLCIPYFHALIAEAYVRVGDDEKALALVVEGRAAGNEFSEYWWTAELERFEGELRLKLGGPEAESEEHFRRALNFARGQNSKSLQLRAVASLSRLWLKQGKKEEARRILSEMLRQFEEGFDTKDLSEAQSLLQELGG